ncbi:MAG: bifunctional 3-deoxy-7-phosphoheptulonate synthase/chorismate mutase type II [Bacteroidales bacterium]|nr:bifunctional 3-deoxy-7-phosphoheptulonate synthase/chorismate mutase type II [Bacteroidales bacterium]
MNKELRSEWHLLPLFGEKEKQADLLIISGPCSAESQSQMQATASGLACAGVKFFRAGIWKPRTRPGSFEGIGAPALKWLVNSANQNNMTPLTEVANEAHVRAALRAGLRNFWIGARTTTNPFAVQEIADVFAQLPEDVKNSVTVLVKNPVNPDLELWIGALQRLYVSGIRRLGAIHRGFSAYGEKFYRNRPEWRIPVELKRRIPELPLICDPSHIAGRRGLVEKVARQAVDMNYEGLIIESHCNPDSALSDKDQQLMPEDVGKLISSLGKRRGEASDNCLFTLRDEIDNIDRELVGLLARRMNVAREIGELKRMHQIPVLQPERYRSLMEERIEEARELGLSPDFMKKIFSTIHDESVNQQLQ